MKQTITQILANPNGELPPDYDDLLLGDNEDYQKTKRLKTMSS